MDKKRPIYLDYHATTPVRGEVAEVMAPLLAEAFGNPASRTHEYGLEAKLVVDAAREKVAAAIGARSEAEVVFVSGATEANNLALRGIVRFLRGAGRMRVVTTAVEHKSVLDTVAVLARDSGVEVVHLPIKGDGSLDLAAAESLINPGTGLVSVMAANNEVGTIYPIEALGHLAAKVGAVFHVDASQAVGKVDINVERMGIHMLSVSAHKIYGPKGVGALYVRRRKPRVELDPIITGGGHEGGLRSGTLPTPLIAGLGEAVRLASVERPKAVLRLAELRDRLLRGLHHACAGLEVNGTLESRLPNNLNVSFLGIDSEALMLSLRDSVAVSNGSACTATDWKSSYVLKAMGIDEARARAAIRFSVGTPTTEADIDAAVALFAAKVPALQAMSVRRSSRALAEQA